LFSYFVVDPFVLTTKEEKEKIDPKKSASKYEKKAARASAHAASFSHIKDNA